MNDEDSAIVATAITRHGDSRWNTPAGAITDVLRDFANAGKIDEIREASALAFNAHPDSRAYVSGRLPAILVHNFLPFKERIGTLIKWEKLNAGWRESVSVNVDSDRLPSVVIGIVESLDAFKASEKLARNS